MSAAIAKKLAVVFGVGAKVNMSVTGKDAVVSDGTTTLMIPVEDFDPKPADGVYELTLTSETEYEPTLRIPAPEAVKKQAATVKNPAPAAKQSSNVGFSTKMPR
jgi:hypothetical protein